MRIVHRTVALSAVAGLLVSACGGKKSGGSGKDQPSTDQAYVQAQEPPDGLDLRVSSGKQGPPAFDRAKLAPARKLDAGETQALLGRAPQITKDPGDEKAFALRPGSQPAPRTGQTITGSFPPPASSLLPAPAGNETG